MNTRGVNTAAGVILAAQQVSRTPAGIAMALESAQMLMTPEIAAELEQLRTRVAKLEAVPTAVYRAEHLDSGIVLGTYANREAARAHCLALLLREDGGRETYGWVPDNGTELAAEELCIGYDVECTGYVVTPVEVDSAYDEEADE